MSDPLLKKFTTPWVAVRSRLRFEPIQRDPRFDDGLWHIHEQNWLRLPVATIDLGDDESPEYRAEAETVARLIAAAPELLAALQGLLAIATSGDPDMDADDRAAFDVAMAAGNAAVSKATGQDQQP